MVNNCMISELKQDSSYNTRNGNLRLCVVTRIYKYNLSLKKKYIYIYIYKIVFHYLVCDGKQETADTTNIRNSLEFSFW